MRRKGQHHSEEFKREAVRLFKKSGKSQHEQARELGIHASTLWAWKEKFDHENDPVAENSLEVVLNKDEEIRRLRKRLATVEEERDFLKKAAAFFAKESQ